MEEIALLCSRGNSYGGGSYGGGGYYRRSPGFVFFDSYDLLWFTSRRPPRYYHEPKQGMSFLESIFSFVFGDGDPNLKFEEERWQTVGLFSSPIDPQTCTSFCPCTHGYNHTPK